LSKRKRSDDPKDWNEFLIKYGKDVLNAYIIRAEKELDLK
jgi:hypothetical protein